LAGAAAENSVRRTDPNTDGLLDPGAQQLVHTVAGNLVEFPREQKFRRVKDSQVRKRCSESGYVEATVVLAALGFVLDAEATWCYPDEPQGDRLRTLRDVRDKLSNCPSVARKARSFADSAVTASPSASGGAMCVSLGDLGRPSTLKITSPAGNFSLLVYPDAYVQVVAAVDYPGWAFTGSGRVRGRVTGVRADQRVLLSVYNGCEDQTVTAHWIDWAGSERISPNLVCTPKSTQTELTYILHNFGLRLSPQQQVVLGGVRVTERPHHTGGRVVVFVTRDADPSALDFRVFAAKCKEIMETVGEDQRDPPEESSRQGRAPAPPPPSANRGKFWGS